MKKFEKETEKATDKDTGHPCTELDIDWSLTTWEGARREQMRRWAELPLGRAIMALEEMEALVKDLHVTPEKRDR